MKLRAAVAAVVVALAVLGSTRLASAQPQSLVITNPASDVTFDEADEYNTLVWNHPLNMSDPTDVHQLDAPSARPNGFNVFTSGCPSGVWCGHSVTDNPDLALPFPGYQGALHVGRDGNLRPINTSLYKR